MADKHGMVCAELTHGTDARAELVSFVYTGNSNTPTDIDNGNIVKIISFMDGEKEIYKAVAPSEGDKLSDLVLVASVENDHDERVRNLGDFYNKVWATCRGYRLCSGALFEVNSTAVESISVNKSVAVNGTKLTLSDDGVGKCIGVRTKKFQPLYCIEIN